MQNNHQIMDVSTLLLMHTQKYTYTMYAM